MAARRFRHEAAGRVTFGLEFDSEQELESFLLGLGGGVPTIVPRAAPARPIDGQAAREVGRPSYDGAIMAAVGRLGPKLPSGPRRAAAAVRVIREEIAKVVPQGEVPSERTVSAWLARNGKVQKLEQKLPQKPERR